MILLNFKNDVMLHEIEIDFLFLTTIHIVLSIQQYH